MVTIRSTKFPLTSHFDLSLPFPVSSKVQQKAQGRWEGEEGQAGKGALFLGQCYDDDEANLACQKTGEDGGLGASTAGNCFRDCAWWSPHWERSERGVGIVPSSRLLKRSLGNSFMGWPGVWGGLLSLCQPDGLQWPSSCSEVDVPCQGQAGWHQQNEQRDRIREPMGRI